MNIPINYIILQLYAEVENKYDKNEFNVFVIHIFASKNILARFFVANVAAFMV